MDSMVGSDKTPMSEVRLHMTVCLAVIMLSLDALNPIKVICSIFGCDTSWIAAVFLYGFLFLLYSHAHDLVYLSVKVFFHSVLTIFFSSMEVLGKQNIPSHGPIIFCGNHMNQFVDGALMLVTVPHRVGFLVAEKSFNQRIIGDFAKAVGSIPVARPQDGAKRGPGKIKFDGLKLLGEGTSFTTLGKGDKLLPARTPDTYRIVKVISDTEGLLAEDAGEASPLADTCVAQGNWVEYDVLAFVDQGKMFQNVQEALSKGNCLGIFPEGGSHDQTDLLPLKVGISAIAFGVLENFDVSVPIVPVGLNYFRGHRFRGRVVVEFGQPITITKELHQLYRENKRAAYQKLLSEVEDGIRSVIVTATDYGELKLIHTVRRLYQQPGASTFGLSTKQRQDLARRFSVAYRLIREEHNGELPDDLKALQDRVQEYQDLIEYWGLKDYQINNLQEPYSKLVVKFVHGCLILFLASIPSLILNAPVGLAASYWARTEAKKDLQKSRVKLAARDVMLSKKILFSIVAVPTLWILYAILLWLFSPLQKRLIALIILSCPMFSCLGVFAVERGMMDLKDIYPGFLRLLPSFRSQREVLPKMRAALAKDVRAMTRKYGPALGALYFDKTGQWEATIHKKQT